MEGTTSKNAKLLATAGFLFITMIWGGSFVVMKNSVDLVPPSYLLALRFTLAAAFMALAFPGRMKKLDRGSLTCGLIMGIFLTLAYLFQTYGIKYTTASKNAFITALYVVLVPFLYWKISKKRPGLNQIAAGLVAVIGLALLTLKHESGINLGDALTFLCGVCFAAQRHGDHQHEALDDGGAGDQHIALTGTSVGLEHRVHGNDHHIVHGDDDKGRKAH